MKRVRERRPYEAAFAVVMKDATWTQRLRFLMGKPMSVAVVVRSTHYPGPTSVEAAWRSGPLTETD